MNDQVKIGCLLVHGFGGIPEEMRPLEKHLQGEGMATRLVQLPGHGQDRPRMAEMGRREWFEQVWEDYRILQEQTDQIFVLGHSMGGLLALLLAAHEPVCGVIGFAPICTFNRMQKAVLWFSRKVGRLPPGPAFCSPDGESLRLTLTGTPVKPVEELNEMVESAPGELRKVKAPVLVFYGGLDPSVKASSESRLRSLLVHTELESVILPREAHLLMLSNKHEVWTRTTRFILENSNSR
jgi:carboxylesterase